MSSLFSEIQRSVQHAHLEIFPDFGTGVVEEHAVSNDFFQNEQIIKGIQNGHIDIVCSQRPAEIGIEGETDIRKRGMLPRVEQYGQIQVTEGGRPALGE